jgi:hypothetical protein
VETNKDGDYFGCLRWGGTKEGDAVGSDRLTLEIGAEFPIGTRLRFAVCSCSILASTDRERALCLSVIVMPQWRESIRADFATSKCSFMDKAFCV